MLIFLISHLEAAVYLFGTLSVFCFVFFSGYLRGTYGHAATKKKNPEKNPIYKLVAHIIILTIIVVIFYFVTRPDILLRSDQCGSR